VALVLLAPVLPLQFALLNLSTRNRNDFRCQAFESLKWRFLFGLHETHYRISWSLIQFLPSENAPCDRYRNDNENNRVARMRKHRTPRSQNAQNSLEDKNGKQHSDCQNHNQYRNPIRCFEE